MQHQVAIAGGGGGLVGATLLRLLQTAAYRQTDLTVPGTAASSRLLLEGDAVATALGEESCEPSVEYHFRFPADYDFVAGSLVGSALTLLLRVLQRVLAFFKRVEQAVSPSALDFDPRLSAEDRVLAYAKQRRGK
jgi:hypothetical protein